MHGQSRASERSRHAPIFQSDHMAHRRCYCSDGCPSVRLLPDAPGNGRGIWHRAPRASQIIAERGAVVVVDSDPNIQEIDAPPTISYDVKQLLKLSSDQLDFALYRECARQTLGYQDRRFRGDVPPPDMPQQIMASDCISVRRLRDEKAYSAAQAKHLAEPMTMKAFYNSRIPVGERARNILDCYGPTLPGSKR